MFAPPHRSEGLVQTEQVAGGDASHRENHARPHETNLRLQVGPATVDFILPRIAVLRRPALEDVADEYVFPVESDREQHGVQ